MSVPDHPTRANDSADPQEVFCVNLADHLSRIDAESPLNRPMHVELRKLVFSHFIAARRLTNTAIIEDPLLCDFRTEFAALPVTKYLHVIGTMHAYGAQKCYADSRRTWLQLMACISAAYDLPDSIARFWQGENDAESVERFRAKTIAGMLGRPEEARRLTPSLHILDRKILLYLAFLTQEPALTDSIEPELNSMGSATAP